MSIPWGYMRTVKASPGGIWYMRTVRASPEHHTEVYENSKSIGVYAVRTSGGI